MLPPMTLNDLQIGKTGRIIGISPQAGEFDEKLREVGFCEGDSVELITRGPFGGQPLAIRLNRKIFALRSEEANAVLIEIA